jgi:archaellum biogenesis protein FlaJ (TadC family)
MDTTVEEEVYPNEDGSFTTFINASLSNDRQMLAFQHALEHIMNNDFGKYCADDIKKAM